MKVLLVNGSPHEKGCVYRALTEVAVTLREEGFEAEIFWIGLKPISGCISCGKCHGTWRCAMNDCVNAFHELAEGADGFIFGSPVYYASATGALKSFMDRLFFSRSPDLFRLKPAAAVVTARRGGAASAFDQINKYFTVAEMPVISSRYWNMAYGNTPEEIEQDAEGLCTMRILARNMAWFIKCKEAGEKAGIALPPEETLATTGLSRYQGLTWQD